MFADLAVGGPTVLVSLPGTITAVIGSTVHEQGLVVDKE